MKGVFLQSIHEVDGYTHFYEKHVNKKHEAKLGKSFETFKKHRQAEYQIITGKAVFTGKCLIKLERKQNRNNIYYVPHKT